MDILHCAFCLKSCNDVAFLVQSKKSGACICDECVSSARDIISEAEDGEREQELAREQADEKIAV